MVRPTLLLLLAIGLCTGCAQSEPGTPYEEGEALLRRGEYDQAIASLTDAIRIEPQNADAYLYRGRAYQGRNGAGDIDAAINDFSTAIDLAPKDYEAYYSRSIAYRDRSDATQSEDDAALSRADHSKARELDPSIADTYATLPDYTDPVEGEIPPAPAPEESAEKTTVEKESPFAARRRISSAAAAASRGENGSSLNGEDEVGLGSSRRMRGESGNPDGQQDDSGNSNDKPPGLRRRIYPDSPPAAQGETNSGTRLDNPIRGVPSTPSPLSGSPSGNAPRITPTPTGPVPNRGGTLPPVGTSPFATPTPSAPPGGATGPGSTAGQRSTAGQGGAAGMGASTALQGATPYRSPFQSPFQTPFPAPTVRTGPAPTGILPSRTLPPTTAGSQQQQQQRPAVTPIPGRINFPATTRRGAYDP